MATEYDKLVDAFKEEVKAEKEYDALMGEFVASGPVGDRQPLPSPKRFLDMKGMEEIQQAEAKKEAAHKAVRAALDLYYRTRPSKRS